jgi:hypothetical protein
MKKHLCLLAILFIGLFPAKAQNADLGIGGFSMPPYGAALVGQTIKVKADIRNFGFTDINAGCAFVTISVPTDICSIKGLSISSSSIWTVYSSSMPGGITLRNTGGTLPADFEPYYIILDVVATHSGGPLMINGYTSMNPFQAECMASGNIDPDNDNATTSIMVPVMSPILPVKFTGFSTKDNGCSGSILWTTADETNVKNFAVQQSFDGASYSTVKTVASKGNGSHTYEVTVNQSQTYGYYRVVASDKDNRMTYGVVQQLQLKNCTEAALVKVFPIPASRNEQISLYSGVNDKITYRLMNASGKVIRTGSFVRSTTLDPLTAGMYWLETISKDARTTQTIIIQ